MSPVRSVTYVSGRSLCLQKGSFRRGNTKEQLLDLCLLWHRSNQFCKLPLRRTLRWRESMGVHIHRNPATRVSHQLLGGFHVLTTSFQQCCKRPAEGMPADDLGDPGTLGCGPNVAPEQGAPIPSAGFEKWPPVGSHHLNVSPFRR
jgi:hypothetical protein